VRCPHGCARVLVSAYGLSRSRVCREGEDVGEEERACGYDTQGMR
jgi:hypothetical protein